MNSFSRYIAYLKDNPEGYWFKRKLYGIGWVPVTWQGWMVVLAALLAIVLNIWLRDPATITDDTVFAKVGLPTLGIIFVLLLISFKTGEPLRWSWGFPKEESTEDIKK